MHQKTTEDGLPLEFSEARIENAIKTLKAGYGVQSYCRIMDKRWSATDLSKNDGFQSDCKYFYGMWMLDSSLVDCYFAFMEEHKNDRALTYKQVLRHLFDKLGSVEASFSSNRGGAKGARWHWGVTPLRSRFQAAE